MHSIVFIELLCGMGQDFAKDGSYLMCQITCEHHGNVLGSSPATHQ